MNSLYRTAAAPKATPGDVEKKRMEMMQMMMEQMHHDQMMGSMPAT